MSPLGQDKETVNIRNSSALQSEEDPKTKFQIRVSSLSTQGCYSLLSRGFLNSFHDSGGLVMVGSIVCWLVDHLGV